jgi:hypothetical protein
MWKVKVLIDCPDDGGSKDLWNIGSLIPVYMAHNPEDGHLCHSARCCVWGYVKHGVRIQSKWKRGTASLNFQCWKTHEWNWCSSYGLNHPEFPISIDSESLHWVIKLYTTVLFGWRQFREKVFDLPRDFMRKWMISIKWETG